MTTKKSIINRLSKATGGTHADLFTPEQIDKFATFYLDKWDSNTSDDVIAESFVDYWWDTDNAVRRCTECGKLTRCVYVISAGQEYYCSDECLHKTYSQTEWEQMYNEDDQTYYTEL